MYCFRGIPSFHDGGSTGAPAMGRWRRVVPVTLPPPGSAGALARLVPVPPVHEPRARCQPLPPAAAAGHAGYLGQPEYRYVSYVILVAPNDKMT